MNLIEANIISVCLLYLFYCHIYRLSSFMEDFSYSVRIHESILVSYFTRYLQKLVKFCRRKWQVNSASKLREQSGFTVSWWYCLNLWTLRRLNWAGKKWTWTFIGGILRYELSVYIRNGRTENYFALDSVNNKKNKISIIKKTSSITFSYFASF